MKQTINKMKIALVLTIMLLLITGCSAMSNVSGFIAKDSSKNGKVSITNSDLEECNTFEDGEAEKTCAVLKGQNCDSCKDYVGQMQE